MPRTAIQQWLYICQLGNMRADNSVLLGLSQAVPPGQPSLLLDLTPKRETQTVKIQGSRRWELKVEVAKSMGLGYSSPTLKFMPIHKKKRTNQRRVPTAINDVFSLSLPFWHTTCSHLPQTQDACHHLYFKEHHSKVENNSEPSSWPWYPVWFGYYPLDLSFHTIQGRELNELENH